MITLASECLVFENSAGEAVPLSAEMISVEMSGESKKHLDEDLLQEAAKAVFHFFKHDLGRQSVTMAEFAEALENALDGFQPSANPGARKVSESDLLGLALESAGGCELIFFPRLRAELKQQLGSAPNVLRFSGLRYCVKHLAGAHRWSSKCSSLQDQIVQFLRECFRTEAASRTCSLIVQ